jgi:hypothetical protein
LFGFYDTVQLNNLEQQQTGSNAAIQFSEQETGKKLTRQTSTSRTNKKCLSDLIQQVVVLLISSKINISKKCLFDIYLMSILI